MSFWTKAPKFGHQSTDWTPGEPRAYIPVLNMGVKMNVPPGGILGKTDHMDGDRRVSFVVRGSKTQGTHARKPGAAK